MEQIKKSNWYKVAQSINDINFQGNGITKITVLNKTVCIVLNKGKLTACVEKCPHTGGMLSNGVLDSTGNIVCPLHHYKFNLQTGFNTSEEGYFLKTYMVKVISEGVFIRLEEPCYNE